MASSDDEAEEAPSSVTQYYFEDDKAEPISFAVLPVWWSTREAAQKSSGMKIYVRGKSGDGLGNLYKIVKAWKFDISGVKPEISVLHEKNWITLQRPRKSYEEFSRTVLITVNFLNLVKRNPELLGNDLWDRMSKTFSSLDGRPSLDDLVDHKALIEKAVERDDSLKKSKYLMMCLEKKLQKINKDPENPRSKGKSAFIVEDDDLEEGGSLTEKDGSLDGEDGEDDEEDDDIFDSVCSICDEGGSILCCDGICMRSFHATLRAAKEADSKCKSLGFSTKEVEAMQTFKCQNCQHKQHQCYSCGVLGSSDKDSGAAEVFQCFNATCGYFYHPSCVAKQLHRSDEEASNALQKDIAAGEPFTCPLHLCFACRQPEDRIDPELRMAVCRRCPKAYHRKCLPRKIAFEDDEDAGIVQRAWDNLLAGRILIYCLKHEIDEDLGTPLRNHIIFPGDAKKEMKPLAQRIMKHRVLQKNKKPSVAPSRPRPAFESKRTLLDKHPSKTDRKISKPQGTDTLGNMSSEKMTDRKIPKPQGTDTLGIMSSEKKPISAKAVLKNPEGSDLVKPKTIRKITVEKSEVKLDSDSETRILKFMEEASSKITLDDVIRKHEKWVPSRVYKQRMDPCRSITDGKVERCTKSVQAAIRKLDAGGSIEDAKAMCEPKILDQLAKWKSKLKVYLAPFIYGMRYTSFGRHFTQESKLKEIVEEVHWYINSNDTIVDFCCGANDFSRLMKEKLESTGKTCNYKNYDLFRPKDDFNFEKRNWMEVQPKELPTGAQLIIGLNPPFGVNASLANQFINKALEFKPKLLILIVPSETERLDKKKIRYDLIWEDRNRLSGKSFYLPGSVDIYDKQMEDWNVVPPILYLWSRHDWTTKHKAVAKEHGHLEEGENEQGLEGFSEKLEHVTETKTEGVSAFIDEPERLKETTAGEKQTALKDQLREARKNSIPEDKSVNKDSRKKRPIEETYTKEDIGSSWEHKRSRSPYNPQQRLPHQSPANARSGTLSPPIRYQTSPPNIEMMDPGRAQFEPTGYRDGRYLRESQPRGFEEFPLDNMEMQGPSHDPFDRSTIYGSGMRSGYTNPVGRYDDRVGIHDPHINIPPGGRLSVDAGPHAGYPPRVSPYVPDYPPQISGEWPPDYMRGSGGHVATHPYSEPGQRFRPSAFSMDNSTHGRRGSMSVMDSYGPRLDQPNYGTRSSYDTGHGSLPETGRYNQGYPGAPMGFTSRPSRDPYQHPHSSSGGWIDD
ncbi:protein ENHANCED DOWNY MILDEW 2 [Silene latifolia]|uniref:protein ENHANCED DOWNY MILDEW 2 n=1 Tax=Silene latifolia TaxID=37657 RepID=UPI003D774CEA